VIKNIPAVWDETIVLPGSEIGELAAFARRSGDKWFLSVMCGPQPKEIRVPLSFLGDGQYKVALVRDGETDMTVAVENSTGKRSDSLTLNLRAGGGFVGRFSRN
jgi:alpha-glucosidase